MRAHLVTKLLTLLASVIGAAVVVLLGSGVRPASLLQALRARPKPETLRWHIDATKEGTSISPGIYGVAAASSGTLRRTGAQVNRWGGNTASRYNWKINAWNTGADWFFENQKVEDGGWEVFLEESLAGGQRAVITIPLIGYVARDESSWSFSVEKYGAQSRTDPREPDAGNGLRADAQTPVPNDPTDASMAVGPEFMKQWIQRITETFPAALEEGRIIFALGNEPMLWDRTHRDVHPDPVSYQEYLRRFTAMAKMVRAAAPQAPIAGPELWGWPALFESARDRESSGRPDRRAHRNMPFLPWFLSELRQYEKNHGTRLIDIVSVHYYPQAVGVLSGETTQGAAFSRMQSTRSLYDPDYEDPSWIGEEVMLIPRVRGWIEEHYPGLKIGITEYRWGAEDHVSGAFAVADAIGAFGAHGVDLACYWQHPPAGSAAESAFAMFTPGGAPEGRFGSRALPSANSRTGERCSPDGLVRLYAARHAEDPDALSVVALNGGRRLRRVRMFFEGCSTLTLQEARRLRSHEPGSEPAPVPVEITGNSARCILEPTSVYQLHFRCEQ